jgi:uncharacterized protein YigA (DUF484 family)
MKNVEEQSILNIEVDNDTVMQYLLQNPDFFIRNASRVEQIRVPHPVRGTISLVEWHLACQHNHVTLFTRLLHLQATMITADSLQDMLNSLPCWPCGFGLVSASMQLFSERWNISTSSSDFTHLALKYSSFEPLCIQRLGDELHFLGCLNSSKLLLLLPVSQTDRLDSIVNAGRRRGTGYGYLQQPRHDC